MRHREKHHRSRDWNVRRSESTTGTLRIVSFAETAFEPPIHPVLGANAVISHDRWKLLLALALIDELEGDGERRN